MYFIGRNSFMCKCMKMGFVSVLLGACFAGEYAYQFQTYFLLFLSRYNSTDLQKTFQLIFLM